MKIGKSSVPLPLNLTLFTPVGQKTGARGALKSALAKGTSRAAATEQGRALTSASRTKTAIQGRDGLYQDLQARLAQLQADRQSPALKNAVTQTTDAAGKTVASVSAEGQAAFTQFAKDVDDLRQVLDGAAGPKGAFKDDTLVADLRDAVRGLFGQSPEGAGVKTLGDLGATLEDDALQLDGNRLAQLAQTQPNDLLRFSDVFFGEPGNQLFKEGAQALADKQAQAPLDQRLAEQSVHVKAELSRLADRQRSLLFQQAAYEKQQDSLKKQEDTLKATRDKLSGKQEQQELPPEVLKEFLKAPTADVPKAAAPTAPAAPSAGATAPQPPGLLSFGLAN